VTHSEATNLQQRCKHKHTQTHTYGAYKSNKAVRARDTQRGNKPTATLQTQTHTDTHIRRVQIRQSTASMVLYIWCYTWCCINIYIYITVSITVTIGMYYIAKTNPCRISQQASKSTPPAYPFALVDFCNTCSRVGMNQPMPHHNKTGKTNTLHYSPICLGKLLQHLLPGEHNHLPTVSCG